MEFAAKMLRELVGIELTPSDLRTLNKIQGYPLDRTTKAFNALTGKEFSSETISKALTAIRLADRPVNTYEDFFKKRPQWDESLLKEFIKGSRTPMWDNRIICTNGA